MNELFLKQNDIHLRISSNTLKNNFVIPFLIVKALIPSTINVCRVLCKDFSPQMYIPPTTVMAPAISL